MRSIACNRHKVTDVTNLKGCMQSIQREKGIQGDRLDNMPFALRTDYILACGEITCQSFGLDKKDKSFDLSFLAGAEGHKNSRIFALLDDPTLKRAVPVCAPST